MTHPMPGADLPENQFERTHLAWRRTMIGLLAVMGIGGIHVSMGDRPVVGVIAGLASVIAIIPIVARTNALRRHWVDIAAWQPLSLVAGLIAMGVLLTFAP